MAVVLFSSFFPLTYFHHLISLLKLSVLSLFCVRECVCACCCVQSLEKLAHPTISWSGVHFSSVAMSEMNISGWNGAERCILTQTRFTNLLLPAMEKNFRPLQVFSDQCHFTGVLVERFLTLSTSVPFWHQGLPLKLSIARHVAYIILRCLDALVF